jgi:hypothetical protein
MRIFRYTMCSTYIRGLGALAAALMLLAFVSARAQTAGGHWTVSAVDGTATITGHGSEGFAASRGQPVVAGTTIATDDDGTVVLTRRGDSITVYPNSQMTVPASTGTEELGILQSFGTLLFRMETRESRDFEVKTPYLAATIKGTTFTVTVGKASAAVSVTEGIYRQQKHPVGGKSEEHDGRNCWNRGIFRRFYFARQFCNGQLPARQLIAGQFRTGQLIAGQFRTGQLVAG